MQDKGGSVRAAEARRTDDPGLPQKTAARDGLEGHLRAGQETLDRAHVRTTGWRGTSGQEMLDHPHAWADRRKLLRGRSPGNHGDHRVPTIRTS